MGMRNKIIAIALLALFFLAMPGFAAQISLQPSQPSSYDLGSPGLGRAELPSNIGDLLQYTYTIYAKDKSIADGAGNNDVTADSITVYDSNGNNMGGCTVCNKYTINLFSGTYTTSVIAKQFISKDFVDTVDKNTPGATRIARLTPDKTAPVTAITLNPAPNADGWNSANVDVTLSATDAGAGVKSTKYCTDTTNVCNPNTDYNAKFTVSSEGVNYVRYFSEDKAQNKETVQSQVVKLDKTAPSVDTLKAKTASDGTDITDSTWTPDNDPYFYWTSTESVSGSSITGYSWALDANADNTVDTTNTYFTSSDDTITDGKHVFHVKAKDIAGNWGAELTFNIWVDASVPDVQAIKAYTTNAMATEITSDAWQQDGLPYFIWTDPASPSDDTFYYTTDGSEPDANSASLNTAVYDRTANAFAEGTATVKVKPLNGAGTWGTARTFVLKYDSTEPVTSITLDAASPDGKNGWYVNDVKVSLSCSDANAGCKQTKYRIDNGAWTNYDGQFTVSDGTHSVDYYSADNAGNLEATKNSGSLQIDKSGPVWNDEQYSSSVVFESNGMTNFLINWTDTYSGLDSIDFLFDSGSGYEVYSPANVDGRRFNNWMLDLPAGDYKFKWNATDKAGHYAESDEHAFTVTKAYANFTLTFSPSANEVYGTQTTVTCTQVLGDAGATLHLYRKNVEVASSTTGAVSDIATLGAGQYGYYCSYENSQNYTGPAMNDEILTINKAVVDVKLFLNGAEADAAQNYGTNSNATATINFGGLTVKLDRTNGGVTAFSGAGLVSDVSLLAAGGYTYKAYFDGNDNYTSDSVTFTLTVNKAPTTVTLLFDGAEGNVTIERGATVNITALLDVSGFVLISIDNVDQTNGQYDFATGTDYSTLKEYKIKAVYAGTDNYGNSEKIFYITVRDTVAPVMTVLSPPNNTVLDVDSAIVTVSSNEDLSGAKVKLDGVTDYVMTGSGTSWSFDMTGLSNGQHYFVVTGTDTASNSADSDTIYFTVNALSHIVNSYVDGVYFADARLNIKTGVSTLVNSYVKDSTVTNSTITDSTVTAKTIRKMVIKNSYVDPADFEGSSFDSSSITENDSNYIRYSNVTTSSINYTDMEYCEVTASVVEYSSFSHVRVWNANISHNYMYTGTLEYNGTNYTMPTNLTALLGGADVTKPIVESVTVNNTLPNPGDTVLVTVVAKDNVAVHDVSLNGTAMNFAGGYSYTWTLELVIPNVNGEYLTDVVVTDYAGNRFTRHVGIVVNSSDTPQVKFDFDAPVVSVISPLSGMEGIITFTANASDTSGISTCWLYVDNVNTSGMNYTNGTASVSTVMSAGTHSVYAVCSDIFGNLGYGTPVNVAISGIPTPPSGGGGGGSGSTMIITELTNHLVIEAPSEVKIVPGQTASFEVRLINAGTADLTDIGLDTMGLPVSWFIMNSKVTKLSTGSTLTNVITISVPATEEIGSKTVTITASSKEGATASKTVTLIITLPEKPSAGNNTTTGNQPNQPSGLTGAIIAVTTSPAAMGLIIAAVIVGGATVWSKRYESKKGAKPAHAAKQAEAKAKEPEKKEPEKADRKYI